MGREDRWPKSNNLVTNRTPNIRTSGVFVTRESEFRNPYATFEKKISRREGFSKSSHTNLRTSGVFVTSESKIGTPYNTFEKKVSKREGL